MRATLAAIRRLEATVTGARGITGIALRYGGFYGPGTGLAPDGEQLEMVRKRRFPIVAGGTGVWSFVHIDDAATATLAALEHGTRGSTTSSTTIPPRCASGCPRSPRPRAPGRRCGCRAWWRGWRRARPSRR